MQDKLDTVSNKHFLREAFNTLEASSLEIFLAKIFGKRRKVNEAPHLGDFGAIVTTAEWRKKVYVIKCEYTEPSDSIAN